MDKIHNFLLKISDKDWHWLRLSIQTAELVWYIQRTFCISDKEMCKKLNITKQMFKRWKRGAYNFKLTDVAKLEIIHREEISKTKLVEIKLEPKK